MNAEQPSGSNAPDAKRQKRDDEAGPSGISGVDTLNPAEIAAIEQTGDIFKLDIDCYEETFDFLPLKDLANVGKTCKRLQQVAGYCFQQNYLGSAYCFPNAVLSIASPIDLTHLIPFVRILMIHYVGYQYFVSVRSKFKHLKEIHCIFLNVVQINCLKEMSMDKVEVLSVENCDLGNNFYKIINQCAKLRRLMVFKCDGEYNWIDRKYPTLEYFKLQSWSGSIKGIAKFLEINPNIRKFATSVEVLWQNLNKFVSANVELNDLAILIEAQTYGQWHSTIYLLKTLYEHGFYKKLQLYFQDKLDQEQVNRLASLNGLNKLGLLNENFDALDFSAFQNIEELYLCADMSISNCEMLSVALINLKRIHFFMASIDVIVPFIRRSVELHRIKINELFSGEYFNKNTKVIDLRALNREREQLPNAQKITLFVKEDIYLVTKWALGDTDFSLIRLKRDTSFDWFYDFEQ